jgi:endonuclease/exonuclease/phosphatase family metal-dependent hydrolase
MVRTRRGSSSRVSTIRLISWNVHNRKDLKVHISTLLRQEAPPHLIALQELNLNAWPETKKTLQDSGFHCIRKGELLIAGRCWKLEHLPLPSGTAWPRRLQSALIHHPVAGKIHLHNTHIPNGSKNDEKKVSTLNAVYKSLARKSSQHRILCGDFNTPKHESACKVFTWGQRVPSGELISNWGKRWDTAERKILKGLAQFDLKDAFRNINGYSMRASSWRKYRIDHIFASSSLRAESCRYLQSCRKKNPGKRLSDHAAIEAFFRPRGRFN